MYFWRMNRRKIYGIVLLMAISLAGITFMQVIWLKNAIKVNEENFNRIVNESLTSVVDKLALEKNLYFARQSIVKPQNPQPIGSKRGKNKITRTSGMQFSSSSSDQSAQLYSLITDEKGNRFRYVKMESPDSNQLENHRNIQDRLRMLTAEGLIDSLESKLVRKAIRVPSSHGFATWSFVDSIKQSVYVFGSDSTDFMITFSDSDTPVLPNGDTGAVILQPGANKRTIYLSNRGYKFDSRNLISTKTIGNAIKNVGKLENQVVVKVDKSDLTNRENEHSKAIDQLVFEMDASKMKLEDRVDPAGVGALLKSELENRGLINPFEFALVTADTVSRIAFATPNYSKINDPTPYKTNLFPKNIIPLNDFLEVKFPDKSQVIYKSVILPISVSGLFTLIILLTFTITLVAIIKQKKLAEMKADFINNMTHELKTPLATISLATDSIDNPKVVEKPETVKYFTSIIRKENSRMNKLVESVLQTARLERKTLKLNLKEVDFNALIRKVTNQMAVQVADKGGEVHLELPGEPVIIGVDESLIENVIFNLLDNALKYCDKVPSISITLRILPGGISISVEDNGIGMSRSDQQKVFDKFYRVSQGDVHNIKGFGLGLSNVKEIVELHGGMVHVSSEIGKGSTFTLYFPVKPDSNE